MTQVLIEHGADITIKNEYGKGLYEMAVSMDRKVKIHEISFSNNFIYLFFHLKKRILKYFDEINFPKVFHLDK